MRLRDFFGDDSVKLRLEGRTPEAVLRELVALLHLSPDQAEALVKSLLRRESLGSTGVGRGIAIPHCRSPGVSRVRLAFGHQPEGVDFHAIDGKPVHHFFLIVAPPDEGGLYLQVLGRIAQFGKEPDVPERLCALTEPAEFFGLLDERGV